MLSKQGIDEAVAMIALIPFFQSSDTAARAIVAKEIVAMCPSDAHALWLATRMGQVFKTRWPGLGEMRALYCKRFRPDDGYESASELFPDGFPSEQELGLLNIEGLPEPPKALQAAPPKSRLISESPDMRNLVDEIAAAVTLPAPKKPRTVAEIEAELYKPVEPKK